MTNSRGHSEENQGLHKENTECGSNRLEKKSYCDGDRRRKEYLSRRRSISRDEKYSRRGNSKHKSRGDRERRESKKHYSRSRSTEGSSSSSSNEQYLRDHTRSSKRDHGSKSKRSGDSSSKSSRKKSSKHDHKSHRRHHKEKCDMWRKRPEFQLWLLEVKQEALEHLPPSKEKELFREYMEDYNTATLAHEKYYSLEKWERKVHARSDSSSDSNKESFNDEELRRKELKSLRDRLKYEEQKIAYESIKADMDKIQAMRHQQELRTQMQALFRMGRIDEAQKIRDRLKATEN